MAIVNGQKYLVSMLGDDVQWVRNLRANGGKAVLLSGGREPVQTEEVPPVSAHPSSRLTRSEHPERDRTRPHVPVNKDAALAEFEKIAAEFPVFRLA